MCIGHPSVVVAILEWTWGEMQSIIKRANSKCSRSPYKKSSLYRDLGAAESIKEAVPLSAQFILRNPRRELIYAVYKRD